MVEGEKAAAMAGAMVAAARVLAARVVAARGVGSREAEGCILEYQGSSSVRAGAAAAAGVDAAAGMAAGMAAAVREGEGGIRLRGWAGAAAAAEGMETEVAEKAPVAGVTRGEAGWVGEVCIHRSARAGAAAAAAAETDAEAEAEAEAGGGG